MRGGVDFPANGVDAILSLQARAAAMERKQFMREAGNGTVAFGEVVWSQPGGLIVDVLSPRWYARRPRTLLTLFTSLAVAGDSTSDFEMFLNGSSFTTYSLAASEETIELAPPLLLLPPMKADDYLQFRINTAGANAVAPCVQIDSKIWSV